MSADTAIDLLKLLAPAGGATIVAGILAYRLPQIIKELFAGVGGLLLTLQKIRREKAARKPSAGVDRRSAPTRSSNSPEQTSSRAA